MAVNTEPAWYQEWLKENITEVAKPVLSTNPEQNNITFHSGDEVMLTVGKDGFYVRGVKVPVDDKEAMAVYNAFSEWLNWQILQGKMS